MTEINIKTQNGVNVHVSEWDEGGAWISLGFSNGSAYTALTRDEVKQMLNGLQAILAKEVEA